MVDKKIFGKKTFPYQKRVPKATLAVQSSFRPVTASYASKSVSTPLVQLMVGLVPVGLMGLAVTALTLRGCESGSDVTENCVDTNDKIVSSACCTQAQSNFIASQECPKDGYPYRWYYGASRTSTYGSRVYGGSHSTVRRSSSYTSGTSRGIFGGHGFSFSGLS